MNKKITLLYLIFGFVALAGFKGYSQINFAPPTINFTQACASASFNSFNFSFSFFPAQNLLPGNQFIVELSNSTGSFTSPTVVKVLTNTTSPVSSSFSLPTNAYGEGYRIRVRSTNPVKISNPSNAFAAYYAIHNQPFSINNNVGTAQICQGTNYTLSIDNTETPASPLYYPSLTYIWYKNFEVIPGATGPSITVSQPGSYYAIVNYGTCVLNSYSNIVQVQVMGNLTPTITSEGNSTLICPSDANTLTSAIQDATYTYQWYKDNVAIPGATSAVYEAHEGGLYHLVVANGPCIFESNAIELEENDYLLEVDPSATTTVIPGDAITLTGITDANAPSYEWYLDDSFIAGATTETLQATQAGTYKVVVTQATPCIIIKEAQVNIAYPSSFNLAIQPVAAYTICSATPATLQVSQFEAVTPEGTVNLAGNTYGYNYQWYKDEVAISGATATTLTLNNASQNGVYKLKASLPGVGEVTSNSFAVNIAIGAVTVTGNTILCEGGSNTLSSSITDELFTYQWYKNNVAVAGATVSTYTATEAGSYHVVVASGTCSAISAGFTIEDAVITVTTTLPDTDTIIPGNTKTLSVTTNAAAPAYAWTRNGVAITGNTASLNATQDGEYTVTVTQTSGCTTSESHTFTLSYPPAFNLAVATDAGYTPCTLSSATLAVSSFTAVTPAGNVDVANMPYNYQWFKDGMPVISATSGTLTLTNATQNGSYKLGVTIPDVGIQYSDSIVINLPIEAILINANTVLCEGSNVLLTANVNGAAYTYQWYKNGIAIAGATAPLYSADAEGDYHVEVSSGTCMAQSNTVNLNIAEIWADSAQPATDVILPGQTKTITITTDAASPAFSWTKDGAPLAETTAALTAIQPGEYKATVTQTAGCAATAEKTFVLEHPSSFNLAIALNNGYTECTSTNATLTVTLFEAVTSQGIIDVTTVGYTYQWYRNNIAVTGATSATIAITSANQNGHYKLGVTIPGFGTVFSNTTLVNLPVTNILVTTSGVLCEGEDVILTANINDPEFAYQWYKDNTAIAGAITAGYTANAEGNYYVTVASGACTVQSDIISLLINNIAIASNAPDTDVILPGETKSITVTTDAASPVYAWTKDGASIPGTTATVTATQQGEYTVQVTQTAGCNATAEKTFVLQYPSSFTISIAANTGYTACSGTSASLQVQSFMAITAGGSIDVSAMGYTYQWYKNDEAINGATSASINVDNALSNGTYKLRVTIPDFGIVFSNTIAIELQPEAITIAANGILCAGADVTLNADITDSYYTYQWYKDNVAIAGATAPQYTTGQEGLYYITVSAGSCSTQSNSIAMAIAQININSTNPDTDVILPGETKTITVTSDAASPAYQWTRNGVLLTETSDALTTTQDGEYSVTVTQTSGCNATATKAFTLQYPTGFDLAIAIDGSYTECTSASAALNVASFVAVTPTGLIDVASQGYTMQWYRNGMEITGATTAALTIDDAAQNGTYKLGVTIPGIATVFSNEIAVTLAIAPVEITANSSLCGDNPSAAITSNTINPDYTYSWYRNSTAVTGATTAEHTATETGDYYVVVDTGTCSYTSNTVTITGADFVLTTGNPEIAYLVPGETNTISISTDAMQPEIIWYHDGEIIPEATTEAYAATQDGEYKVVVTQTEGCMITKELTFSIEYATNFEINIIAGEYTPCTSTAVALGVLDFSAVTPLGPVDVEGSGYLYQWYFGNNPLPGATTTTLDATESGQYYLQVEVPETGTVTSNIITLQLAFEDNIEVTTNDVMCAEGSPVRLLAGVNRADFTYAWYKDGETASIGNESTVVVTGSGSYYVEVSYGGCTITSNSLQVTPVNPDTVTIDIDHQTTILAGTTITVNAEGGESYEWLMNGQSFATGSSVEISEAGNYAVIAIVGECNIAKEFDITVRENNVLNIPNVVTPNGDGINDVWALPEKYINNEDIEVMIYGPDGSIVFRSTYYENNWPESNFIYTPNSPVYYYTIMEKNKITERGSITIIK